MSSFYDIAVCNGESPEQIYCLGPYVTLRYIFIEPLLVGFIHIGKPQSMVYKLVAGFAYHTKKEPKEIIWVRIIITLNYTSFHFYVNVLVYLLNKWQIPEFA